MPPADEALDRMQLPQPRRDLSVFRRKVDEIVGGIDPGQLPSMAEFDAEHYDEYGLPR